MALAVSDVFNDGTDVIDVDMPANGVVVLHLFTYKGDSPAPSGVSVTSANLTWTQRQTQSWDIVGDTTIYATMEQWYATSTSAFSAESVTITSSDGLYYSSIAIAITGANTTTPFDVNGSLPAKGTFNQTVAPTLSVSTTNANTIIIGAIFLTDEISSGAEGTGYTYGAFNSGITPAVSEYKIVSSTQSSLAVGWNAAVISSVYKIGMMADAVQQAGGAAATPAPKRSTLMMMGV